MCYGAKQQFEMKTITVGAPRAGEVRIKVLFSGICHTGIFFCRFFQFFGLLFLDGFFFKNVFFFEMLTPGVELTLKDFSHPF